MRRVRHTRHARQSHLAAIDAVAAAAIPLGQRANQGRARQLHNGRLDGLFNEDMQSPAIC